MLVDPPWQRFEFFCNSLANTGDINCILFSADLSKHFQMIFISSLYQGQTSEMLLILFYLWFFSCSSVINPWVCKEWMWDLWWWLVNPHFHLQWGWKLMKGMKWGEELQQRYSSSSCSNWPSSFSEKPSGKDVK